MYQAAAAAEPVGTLLMERQLVGRVDGLAAAPASRADGSRQQRGCFLDGVYRLYKVRALFLETEVFTFFSNLSETGSTFYSLDLNGIRKSFSDNPPLPYLFITASFRLFDPEWAVKCISCQHIHH